MSKQRRMAVVTLVAFVLEGRSVFGAALDPIASVEERPMSGGAKPPIQEDLAPSQDPSGPLPSPTPPPPTRQLFPADGPLAGVNLRKPAAEGGLGALQVTAGSLTMGLLGLVALSVSKSPAVSLVVFLVGPPVTGGVICQIGKTSHDYEGGCLPAIGYAYVGAVTALPLAILGCQVLGGIDEPMGCIRGRVLGLIVGFVLGTAVMATVGWHAHKQVRGAEPRAGLLPVATDERIAFATPRPGWLDNHTSALRLSIPVLFVEF